MSRIAYLLPALAAAAVIAAGCGDDDEDTTTTAGATGATGAAGALTKSEFITQADEICAEGDREIERTGEEMFGAGRPSGAELEAFAEETVAPSIQDQLDQIRELPAPEGDEEEVSAILDAAQEGVDMIEEDPSLLAQGRNAGGAFTEANRLAEEYGLEDCGGG